MFELLHPFLYLPLWMQATVLGLAAYFLLSLMGDRTSSFFSAVSLGTSYFMLILISPVINSW